MSANFQAYQLLQIPFCVAARHDPDIFALIILRSSLNNNSPLQLHSARCPSEKEEHK